jgi:hypothetical protein
MGDGEGGMIALAALALALGIQDGRPSPVYMFQGQLENLEKLVRAAHGCGLGAVEISLQSPHLTPAVLIAIPTGHDPGFECTTRWIEQHPEAGFRVPGAGS